MAGSTIGTPVTKAAFQAEGADWQRQRKLTATPFNEQKSVEVWTETLRQADSMVKSWTSSLQEPTTSTTEDTRTLALHVLAYAGFQKSYPFESVAARSGKYRPLTYRDSVSIILQNIFLILVLPSWFYNIPVLPARWKRVGEAITHFQQYMKDQLANERQLIVEGKPGSGTLMSNLVRASAEVSNNGNGQNTQSNLQSKPSKGLSINEILGNIFVFNFAGHDTTATALNYSMLLLTCHPQVQDWIYEELEFQLPGTDLKAWQYDDSFPKLKRCLAVLVRH